LHRRGWSTQQSRPLRHLSSPYPHPARPLRRDDRNNDTVCCGAKCRSGHSDMARLSDLSTLCARKRTSTEHPNAVPTKTPPLTSRCLLTPPPMLRIVAHAALFLVQRFGTLFRLRPVCEHSRPALLATSRHQGFGRSAPRWRISLTTRVSKGHSCYSSLPLTYSRWRSKKNLT
jgi:hypothetical protein